MSDTQTLTPNDPAEGNLDVTWSLEEYTDWNGDKLWVVRIKICNTTGKRIHGRIVENPWRAEGEQRKVYSRLDANGNETANADDARATAKGRNITIPAGKCEDHLFDYREKPGVAYTDIFLYGPDGTLNKAYTWGMTQELTPVVISSLPSKRERTLCLKAPLPFFMSLGKMTDGPVRTTISDITVPEGFVLADCWPAIGEPVEVQHGERGNQAAVVLRQVEPIPEGSRLKVLLTQKVSAPRQLANWPPRLIGIDLVNDRKPPKITVKKVAVTKKSVEIEALLKDACSGTASAQLIVQTQDHSVSVEPASLKGDGHGYRIATFACPRSWLDEQSTLTIRAVDYAGNVARKKLISPLGTVSRKKPSR